MIVAGILTPIENVLTAVLEWLQERVAEVLAKRAA